jgi:hypothetical protein
MMVARMGSLQALEQERGNRFWRRWLGVELSSADTAGRVFAQVEIAGLRVALRALYSRLKRNEALSKREDHAVLILDGHESSASYYRCCPGCLERVVHTQEGDRLQF